MGDNAAGIGNATGRAVGGLGNFLVRTLVQRAKEEELARRLANIQAGVTAGEAGTEAQFAPAPAPGPTAENPVLNALLAPVRGLSPTNLAQSLLLPQGPDLGAVGSIEAGRRAAASQPFTPEQRSALEAAFASIQQQQAASAAQPILSQLIPGFESDSPEAQAGLLQALQAVNQSTSTLSPGSSLRRTTTGEQVGAAQPNRPRSPQPTLSLQGEGFDLTFGEPNTAKAAQAAVGRETGRTRFRGEQARNTLNAIGELTSRASELAERDVARGVTGATLEGTQSLLDQARSLITNLGGELPEIEGTRPGRVLQETAEVKRLEGQLKETLISLVTDFRRQLSGRDRAAVGDRRGAEQRINEVFSGSPRNRAAQIQELLDELTIEFNERGAQFEGFEPFQSRQPSAPAERRPRLNLETGEVE